MTKIKKKLLQPTLFITAFSVTVVLTLLVGWALAGSFSFRDEFTTSRAAGSFNATSAEPGPGTRKIGDTTNLLSIANEKLTFSGSRTAWADPAYWSNTSFARVPGLLLITAPTVMTGDYSANWGWFGAKDSSLSLGNRFKRTGGAGGMGSYNSGSAEPAFFSLTTPLSQTILTVAARSSGAFYFIKAIPAGYHGLYWASIVDSTTPLYVGLQNYSYSSGFTIDYIRIPTTLWLPSPTISDGFSAATSDGLGHAETTGLGSGGSGLTWTDPGTTWTVAGGVLYNTPATGAELNSGNLVVKSWYEITATQANYFYTGCAIGNRFWATAATALDANNKVKLITLNTMFRTRDATTANIIADIKLSANPAGTQAGFAFNLDSASSPTTYGLLYYDGTNIKVDEIIASGTPTSKISSAYTWAAGTILRLIRDGTELRAYVWNGTTWAQVGTTQSMNAALTGTLHGTFSTYSGNTMDNFVLYPRGTEGQWGFLEELNSLDDGSDDLLLFRRSRAGR